MRFRKYVCPSPEAKKFGGCLYSSKKLMDLDAPCSYCGKTFDETRTIWWKVYMAMPYWLRRPFQSPWRDISRFVRFTYQRETRGFDSSELWSLDHTIAKFIAPRLRAFIDEFDGRSHPAGLTSKQWRAKLEKMHKAFELMASDKMWIANKKEAKSMEEGLDLFREWFFHLWD